MTIRQALDTAARQLAKAGVDSPRLNAQLLLASLLNTPHLQLMTMQGSPLEATVEARFFKLVARRASREPLQTILGYAHFMGHAFLTAPDVLIPRQDTETLCERALSHVHPGSRVLDLCCGSGCLAISIKLAQPEAAVYASDISAAAIALTQRNALRLGATITPYQGDLFVPFAGMRFDVILSNPPYIPLSDMPGLQEEVRQEPALALEAGPDGLLFYRRILKEAAQHLKPGGHLLLELGDSQAAAVSALVPHGFSQPLIHMDLAGLPRVLETRYMEGVSSSYERLF